MVQNNHTELFHLRKELSQQWLLGRRISLKRSCKLQDRTHKAESGEKV